VHRAVLDRDCVIPDGMVIGEDAATDAERFVRSDGGITLVTREMLDRLGA
jgi:glucose-1-phosphate adenylyltransferase